MRIHSVTAEFLGVNCYAVAPDDGENCVLFDAGLDGAPDLARLVEREALTPAAIVLTHGHPDHVLGLPGYLERWNVPVYLAAPDHYRLDDPAATLDGQFRQIVTQLVPGWRRPEVLELPTSAPLEAAGLRIATRICPGHTEGSAVLAVSDAAGQAPAADAASGANAANGPDAYFTGDVLFAGSVGRTDLPGGDPAAMTESLAYVRTLPDAPAYPGHGEATTIAREVAGNPFLRE